MGILYQIIYNKQNKKMNEINVGMGELKFGYIDDTLVSLGLGSCVGVVIYDKEKKIAALSHIMLPSIKEYDKQLPKKQILIADNHFQTRNTLKKILSIHSYEIIETKEQNETLKIYKKLNPKVSLVSAYLPPTNGVDMIKHLLAYSSNANAIIITNEVKKETLLFYLNNGAKDVISNPNDENDVIGSIEQILYKKQLKYADKAVDVIYRKMLGKGCNKKNLCAKIAGGAHMFDTISDSDIAKIGQRNVNEVKKCLKEYGIKLIAHDTGLNFGRTIRFNVNTTQLNVKTINGKKEI
jgi:chemotaxis receptor (MCP) glutamine deamidase CheD